MITSPEDAEITELIREIEALDHGMRESRTQMRELTEKVRVLKQAKADRVRNALAKSLLDDTVIEEIMQKVENRGPVLVANRDHWIGALVVATPLLYERLMRKLVIELEEACRPTDAIVEWCKNNQIDLGDADEVDPDE